MFIKILQQHKLFFSYHHIYKFSTISSMQLPTQGKTIIKQGNTQLLLEGKAKIYTKYIEKNDKNQLVENQVFYNPVQIFNRDFTILVMQAYIELLKEEKRQKFDGVSIVDALSASGLRTIRFLKQLQGVKIIYANDLSPASHKLMKDNFTLNDLDPSKYKMTLQDANMLLINSKKDIQFDIVDLDPYGSVVPFLDSAVESIKDGGLMCITCTDNKVTAGPDLTKCYYYYGSTRAKVHHFNQNALRVVLSTISSAASRHCKYIEPMISFQTDFYLRVFLRVYRGKNQCAQSGLKIGNVYNCNACGNYQYSSFFQQKKQNHLVPKRQFIKSNICEVCDQPYYLNGPIWLGELNNIKFAQKMIKMMQDKQFKLDLKTHKKVYGTLVNMVGQGQLSNVPLGFNFDKMCKTIRSTCPNKKLLYSSIQSLKNNYKIAPSYISPGLYKTNAPIKVIYDIIKSWKLKDMGEDKYISPMIKEQFSIRILKKDIENKPDFQYELQEEEKKKIKNKVPQFIKLGKNLGPKGKPLTRVLEEGEGQNNGQIKKQGDI